MRKFLCLCLCALMLLAGCGKEEPEVTPTTTVAEQTYTVTVTTAGGMGLEKINVYIYEDSTLQELVAVVKTDAEGKASFTYGAADTYVAVLQDVPTSYATEEFYPLTGTETAIALQADQTENTDLENLSYKLGDAMMDFSVTGSDGTAYTFNELIKDKKAVVLNFFYNECQPCLKEFPYLQEAYAQYQDQIAVLAMNPVNADAEAVEALRKQLEVTFPMVACDAKWESAMQITAYPTTVIIDRFGNICLIHKGSVPDAKTFADAFAYFAADDYEQKLVEAISDLAVKEEDEKKEEEDKKEEAKENPTEVGGVSNFEFTVEPGNVEYVDIYKVTKMYLRIKSKNAYIIYKEKTYQPDNGVVSALISVPDTFTPVKVGIGNSGDKTETFKASFVAPSGTFNNPLKMKLGDFTAKVSAGNEQGVYYTYKATEDGTLTLQCISASKNVEYGYYLFNTKTNAMRNLESDAQTDANGLASVSVEAKKGQTIQVCISTLPDDKGSYPAGTFKFHAAFTGKEIVQEEQIKTTDYGVIVTDDTGTPISNVNVVVKVENENKAFITDAQGVAKFTLPTDTYEGSFYVPDGYTAEVTAFTLTEAAPAVQMTIVPIRSADYTVTVTDNNGAPMQNVFVRIGDGAWLRTDAQGKLMTHLDVGTYTVMLMLPSGYSGQMMHTFPEGETALTVVLTDLTGTVQKPVALKELGLQVVTLAAGDADGYCYKYTASEAGIFSLQVKDVPAAAYDVELSAGTRKALMSQSGVDREVTLQLAAGETVRIHVYAAVAADGSYPAVEVRMWTAMKPLPVEPQPEVPTTPVVPEGPTGETTLPGETETQPTVPGTSVPETTVPGTTAPEATVPGATTPEPTVPQPTVPEPVQTTYSVTVIDAFGAGVPEIAVIFLQDGIPVQFVNTDASGVAVLENEMPANYTVELVFGDTQYYYDKASAVLTADSRNLTIRLASWINESDYQQIYILNGNPAYTLYVGGTHVDLGSGKPNFSAEYENNCFFVFTPEVAGTYRITAAPDVELSYWSTPNFISRIFGSRDEGMENALTLSISGTTVGNATYVIGVKADTPVTETVVTVARIGEPEFSIADQPWSEWESGLTPDKGWMQETGTSLKSDGTGYNYNFQVSYLDITAASGTYNLYYDEACGYYRLREGGPIVLVDMGAKERFVPLFERVNGKDAYGGSAVTRYFFDNTGAFVKKEDYTEYLNTCFTEMLMSKGNPTGFYPLTKDMMYVLQNGFVGWWSPENPNYLEGFATANTEYAWMFPCCVIS